LITVAAGEYFDGIALHIEPAGTLQGQTVESPAISILHCKLQCYICIVWKKRVSTEFCRPTKLLQNLNIL